MQSSSRTSDKNCPMRHTALASHPLICPTGAATDSEEDLPGMPTLGLFRESCGTKKLSGQTASLGRQ